MYLRRFARVNLHPKESLTLLPIINCFYCRRACHIPSLEVINGVTDKSPEGFMSTYLGRLINFRGIRSPVFSKRSFSDSFSAGREHLQTTFKPRFFTRAGRGGEKVLIMIINLLFGSETLSCSWEEAGPSARRPSGEGDSSVAQWSSRVPPSVCTHRRT